MTFSVIIPTYNSERTVVKTIESMLAQSAPLHEIIVIDDGSEDNTQKILEKFGTSIIYRKQKNSGVSIARNHGAKIATGDWIAFCDADDLWHENKIELIKEAIKKDKSLEFIFHDFYIFYKDKIINKATHSKKSIFPIIKDRKYYIPDLLENHSKIDSNRFTDLPKNIDYYSGRAFLYLINGNFILPSAVVLRRNIFLDSGGFDSEFKVAEDTELFLRISKKAKLTYIDYPLTGYRKGENSLTSNIFDLYQFGLKAIIKNGFEDKKIYQTYKSNVDQALAIKYSNFAYFFLTELDKQNAKQFAIKSIEFDRKRAKAYGVLLLSILPKFLLKSIRKLKSIL